mmetsp:Transcript_21385/g.64138  ORF Transcript_21385/g.64138 Transcript_21385/m.64138 type:complete len:463 (-) Transcript_21385:798-2186(-)
MYACMHAQVYAGVMALQCLVLAGSSSRATEVCTWYLLGTSQIPKVAQNIAQVVVAVLRLVIVQVIQSARCHCCMHAAQLPKQLWVMVAFRRRRHGRWAACSAHRVSLQRGQLCALCIWADRVAVAEQHVQVLAWLQPLLRTCPVVRGAMFCVALRNCRSGRPEALRQRRRGLTWRRLPRRRLATQNWRQLRDAWRPQRRQHHACGGDVRLMQPWRWLTRRWLPAGHPCRHGCPVVAAWGAALHHIAPRASLWPLLRLRCCGMAHLGAATAAHTHGAATRRQRVLAAAVASALRSHLPAGFALAAGAAAARALRVAAVAYDRHAARGCARPLEWRIQGDVSGLVTCGGRTCTALHRAVRAAAIAAATGSTRVPVRRQLAATTRRSHPCGCCCCCCRCCRHWWQLLPYAFPAPALCFEQAMHNIALRRRRIAEAAAVGAPLAAARTSVARGRCLIVGAERRRLW